MFVHIGEQMTKLQEDLSKEREEVRTLRVALEKQLNQGGESYPRLTYDLTVARPIIGSSGFAAEMERLKVEELQGLAKALGKEREEAVEKERARGAAQLQQLTEEWEDRSQKLRQTVRGHERLCPTVDGLSPSLYAGNTYGAESFLF